MSKADLTIPRLIGLEGILGAKKLPAKEQLKRIKERIESYHIPFSEADIANRVIFLPGSQKRAEKIRGFFTDSKEFSGERDIVGYSGIIKKDNGDIPVAVIASGMGSGQIEIILWELIRAGAGAVIRYGSCGALKPYTKVGDLAVGIESVPSDSSFAYMTDEQIKSGFWPPASDELLFPITRGLEDSGYINAHKSNVGQEKKGFYVGAIHSKALLYAQEIGIGPRAHFFDALKKELEEHGEIIASEMETSLLFAVVHYYNSVLFSALSSKKAYEKKVLVSSINFFIGDINHPYELDPAKRKEAQEKLTATVPNIAKEVYREMAEQRNL
ncbi:hypothetical protein KY339_03155 [Candidatus Woesearchaeota archaeon]|nr:hypothetical protein [Candidatus Woesearchaeota archaeon]